MYDDNAALDSAAASGASNNETEAHWQRPGYPLSAAAEAFSGGVEWTPELQLMLAILEDAIACYLQTLTRPRQNPEILARQAEYWIRLEDWDSPFSFNNICEALAMNPAALRDRLLKRRENAAAQPSSTDGCKKTRLNNYHNGG